MEYAREFIAPVECPPSRRPAASACAGHLRLRDQQARPSLERVAGPPAGLSPACPKQLDPADPRPSDPFRTKVLRGVHRIGGASGRIAATHRRRPPVQAYVDRVVALARARLPALARTEEKFWLARSRSSTCPAADLGFLATGAAHGPPSGPGRHVPSAAGRPGTSHLRTDCRRQLDWSGSNQYSGRRAPGRDIMQA